MKHGVTEFQIQCCVPGCKGIVYCLRRSPRQKCVKCQKEQYDAENILARQFDAYEDKRY